MASFTKEIKKLEKTTPTLAAIIKRAKAAHEKLTFRPMEFSGSAKC